MIAPEDVRTKIIEKPIAPLKGSSQNPNVKKAIQAFVELQRKWVLLHTTERMDLTSTLAFFAKLLKSKTEILHTQTALKEFQESNPQELRAVARTLEKLETLKIQTKKTLTSLFVFHWFEKAELFYFMAKQQKLLPQEVDHFSDNTPFWNILSRIVHKALKYALDDIPKHLTEEDRKFFENFILHLSKSIEDYVSQTKTHIKKVNMLYTMCITAKGRFLRFFNQNKHPYTQGIDTACLGLSLHWAEQLHHYPPLQFGLHSQHFAHLLPLFQLIKEDFKSNNNERTLESLLKQEFDDILPQTFPFTYLRFGESYYSFRSVEYQVNGFLYLHQDKIPTRVFDTVKGEEIARKALQLFSPDTNISTLLVSLNTLNQDKHPPHAIAFAQIRLADQLTVYRVMDADHGEFELYSEAAFCTFLEKYFEYNGYTERYCRGYLKIVDGLFGKYHLTNKAETPMEQLKEKEQSKEKAEAKENMGLRLSNIAPTLSKSDPGPCLSQYRHTTGGKMQFQVEGQRSLDPQSLPGLELEKSSGKGSNGKSNIHI